MGLGRGQSGQDLKQELGTETMTECYLLALAPLKVHTQLAFLDSPGPRA